MAEKRKFILIKNDSEELILKVEEISSICKVNDEIWVYMKNEKTRYSIKSMDNIANMDALNDMLNQ